MHVVSPWLSWLSAGLLIFRPGFDSRRRRHFFDKWTKTGFIRHTTRRLRDICLHFRRWKGVKAIWAMRREKTWIWDCVNIPLMWVRFNPPPSEGRDSRTALANPLAAGIQVDWKSAKDNKDFPILFFRQGQKYRINIFSADSTQIIVACQPKRWESTT